MSRRPDATSAAPCLSPSQAEEVRKQLERVVDSHQFRASLRCHGLLRRIVEQTVTGDTVPLKKGPLGVEVFGLSPDYDTAQDPVVRATAAEIRKKLAQYYQEPEHASELRIELHSGSYIALFHFNGGNATPGRPFGHRRAMVVGGVGAVLVVLSLALVTRHAGRSALDRFWSPLITSQGTILISVGQPIAYHLKSFQAQDYIQGINPPPPGFAAEDAIP